jgi:hypothetical protein
MHAIRGIDGVAIEDSCLDGCCCLQWICGGNDSSFYMRVLM